MVIEDRVRQAMVRLFSFLRAGVLEADPGRHAAYDKHAVGARRGLQTRCASPNTFVALQQRRQHRAMRRRIAFIPLPLALSSVLATRLYYHAAAVSASLISVISSMLDVRAVHVPLQLQATSRRSALGEVFVVWWRHACLRSSRYSATLPH